MDKENLNFGFLYLNGLHFGEHQKAVFDINTKQIMGYVNDDFSQNHLLLSNVLNAAKDAYKNQENNLENRISNLHKICILLDQNIEELSLIMSKEIGKKLSDCKQEIKRSIIYIEDTIRYYRENYLDYITIDDYKWTHDVNKIGKFKRVPLGVILGIIPFNFPINLLITKLAPAYLTGNAVIIKPSSKALMTTSYFASLVYQAGILDNMIQIVNVPGNKELYDNDIINMISFTGSTKVGNEIAKIAYKIPIVLEMGGKDVCLVLDDADLEKTANGIIKGAFSYNGQRCTAIKKVLVSKQNHDKLINLLLEKIKTLKIGSSVDNNDITPMIDMNSINFVNNLVNDSKQKGAIIIPDYNVKNQIIYPCLIENVTNDMKIAFEEQFAPILPIQIYTNLDQAIEFINQSEYGLQASIYCKNESDFFELASKIETGTVNWNAPSSRGPDIFPFLGVKSSGLGVQGIKDALDSMTRVKGFIINK